MRKITLTCVALAAATLISGCGRTAIQSTDSKIAEQQEQQQTEGAAQVPPAAIVNWNEKRQLKYVLEVRDQTNLATWTYTKNMDGKYTWICESIGYGIPYATRSTNPQHYEYVSTKTGVVQTGDSNYVTDQNGKRVWGEHALIAAPEPSGVYLPGDSKGTWNICRNPDTGKPAVTYQEEDISVFPYRLPAGMVEGFHPTPLPAISKEEVEAAYKTGVQTAPSK